MPQLLAELKGAITSINDKLDTLLENGSTPSDTWMDLDAFRAYHPDKPTLLPGLNIRVSDFLEKNATPQQREAHIDIADRLIEEILNPVPHPVLQPQNPAYSVLKYFSEEYRDNIRELIDELDLVPISVSRITGNA